jgi:glycosyltransferase involved in cell wall biosynthesis
MKVVAVLDIPVSAGGGFNQALTAIVQMYRACTGEFEFEVVTSIPENVATLERLGIAATLDADAGSDRLESRLSNVGLVRRYRARFDPDWRHPIERRLLARGADLVYLVGGYTVPSRLRTLNYIYTVWDLCHRDQPEFPEIRDNGAFETREALFRQVLPPAVLVITDSVQLIDRVEQRYGVDRDRMLPMPFAPAPFLDASHATPTDKVLARYRLERDYLFYPAQFWAHKNHVRILEALDILRGRGRTPTLVLSGGDQGNRRHVETTVAKFNLQNQVKFLGFVAAEDMRGLYDGCAALVMPTYFGPTNIPPLEAWMLERPVIYSAHLKEQARDAALLVNPDDANDLAMAIDQVSDPATRARLVAAGTKRLAELKAQRADSERILVERLRQFAARRRSWA